MASDETVADILREMRGDPLSWLSPEGIPQMTHDNDEVRAYADRIEAALVAQNATTGNAAAMRAALDSIAHIAEGAFDVPERDREASQDRAISLIVDAARAALAAPVRNCDRFRTNDEAREAWEAETRGHHWPVEVREVAFPEWLFAPAEGGAE